MAEWSNEIILEFLRLYESEPAIWNPKHPHHRNRIEGLQAWDRIKAKMPIACSVRDLKKKKDSLMATFRPLAHRVKEGLKVYGEEYQPNWFAYKTMEKFLMNIYQPKLVNNTDLESDQETDSFLQDDTVSENSEPTKATIKGIKQVNSDPLASRQNKRHSSDPETTKFQRNVKLRYDTFGNHVTYKLSTYSKHVANQVEYRISKILYEADMGFFNEPDDKNLLEPLEQPLSEIKVEHEENELDMDNDDDS